MSPNTRCNADPTLARIPIGSSFLQSLLSLTSDYGRTSNFIEDQCLLNLMPMGLSGAKPRTWRWVPCFRARKHALEHQSLAPDPHTPPGFRNAQTPPLESCRRHRHLSKIR